MRGVAVMCWFVLSLAACGTGARGAVSRDQLAPDIAGWEGFYRPRDVNEAWLDARGIGIDPGVIGARAFRVVRVIMATGEAQVPRSRVEQLLALHCANADTLLWNEDLCGALHAAVCDAGVCTYQHFGSCSGLAIGAGWVVTAAHCLAPLDDAQARRSMILWLGADGRPRRSSSMGEIRLGKRDFGHDWVALDDEDPVDVAAVRTDDAGLSRIEPSPLPSLGAPVFVFGYPRVERRTEAARRRAGYELIGGTPSVSFGRLADRNEANRPLCSVDGTQEHWRLADPCPSGTVTVNGEGTWRGVILRSPFLATYDACNGYSGAPVFDARGRWIGVNVTLTGGVNPQDRFAPQTRMVATVAARAVSRLGL